MANIVEYSTPSSWATALSGATDLDSKANLAATVAGAVIDNTTNKDLFVEFALVLGSINPSGAPYFELHLLQELDTSGVYADKSNNTLVDVIAVATGSGVKGSKTELLRLGPGKYKAMLVNNTGVTLAASGNTFQYRTYSYNNNGS